MSTSRVAHYADVRWGSGGPVAGPAGVGANRTVRERAVKTVEARQISPRSAAATVVAASLATGRRGLATAGTVRASAPRGSGEAVRLAEQFYRRADKAASVSGTPSSRTTAGIGFPDVIFRRVVGFFASDVIDYLYGGWAERMREPVRKALRATPRPDVIVAHSLGTIITFDVLSEPEFASLNIALLTTLGCPLGIGNVQKKLRNSAKAAPGADLAEAMGELRRPLGPGRARRDAPQRVLSAGELRDRRGRQQPREEQP